MEKKELLKAIAVVSWAQEFLSRLRLKNSIFLLHRGHQSVPPTDCFPIYAERRGSEMVRPIPCQMMEEAGKGRKRGIANRSP